MHVVQQFKDQLLKIWLMCEQAIAQGYVLINEDRTAVFYYTTLFISLVKPEVEKMLG